jgi:triacylglycerol esterase/lipase EstA (alpha/beta hydrolase family)
MEPLAEGTLLAQGVRADDSLSPCGERLHAVVGAEGSRWELTLLDWVSDSPAVLEVRDWNGVPLGRMEGLASGDTVAFELAWSGEHALVVASDDGRPATYGLQAQCLEGCDTVPTRYPIVLMHGMAGTDAFFDLLHYYYDVAPTLQAAGYAVHAPAVDPFQPSEVRTVSWAAHLDELFASGEARRVNLIGHSQGGLDARYLAAHLDPDHRIRSVTTIATPHRGAAIADVVWGLVGDVGLVHDLADLAFDELAALYGLSTDQDIVAQLEQLTSAKSGEFNADVRDRADVAYYSWAGKTCQLVDLFCQADHDGEIVSPLFTATHAITLVLEGDNDGLVSVESSEWGTFRGIMNADHLDEVGLLAGTENTAFDHLQFFLDEAAFLASQGF